MFVTGAVGGMHPMRAYSAAGRAWNLMTLSEWPRSGLSTQVAAFDMRPGYGMWLPAGGPA
jgi:hypothetical protein